MKLFDNTDSGLERIKAELRAAIEGNDDSFEAPNTECRSRTNDNTDSELERIKAELHFAIEASDEEIEEFIAKKGIDVEGILDFEKEEDESSSDAPTLEALQRKLHKYLREGDVDTDADAANML